MTPPSLDRRQLSTLAAAAVAAPSADNRHDVRVQATASGLRLRATAALMEADALRRHLALLSTGAVVENLWWTARSMGLQPSVRAPDRAFVDDDTLVWMDMAPGPAPAAPGLEAQIFQRRSNRRLSYGGRRLTPADLADLSSLPDEDQAAAGLRLAWLDGPQRTAAIAVLRQAEERRFVQPDLHRDMMASLRFDRGWREPATTGIPLGALGLSALERPGFLALRHWPMQRAANVLGMHKLLAVRAVWLPCRLAPHLGVILCDAHQAVPALQVGRLLQRAWLQATSIGASMQVFAALPLYADPQTSPVPEDVRRRLSTLIAAALPQGLRPAMFFRLGRGRPVAVSAGRPDPASLLEHPEPG